jgi:hypothetical protein
MFLNRTAAERIFTFLSQIGRNSGSPAYHFRRQLPQLSDGPSNSSKWLAICELRQLETRLVTESAFLGRLHLPAQIRFLVKFHHDLTRNFIYKKCHQQNFAMTSQEWAFCWLPIRLISTYGLVTTVLWSSISVLDRLWTEWTVGVWSGFGATRWVRLVTSHPKAGMFSPNQDPYEVPTPKHWRIIKHIHGPNKELLHEFLS